MGQYNHIHRALREKAFECVKHGVTRRGDLRRHLKMFAEDNFKGASVVNASYYPNDKSLTNALYDGRMRLRYDRIDDQNNVELMVKEWREKLPQDFFYYRPKTKEDDLTEVTFEGDEEDILHSIPSFNAKKLKTSLLYIHQSYGQKEILKR